MMKATDRMIVAAAVVIVVMILVVAIVLFLVETGQVILSNHILVVHLDGLDRGLFAAQVIGFLSSAVHVNDILGLSCGDGLQVHRTMGIGRVRNLAFQWIG